MAQSGYGYDPLQTFHPQAPYPHQPYPTYPAASYRATDPNQAAIHNNEAAAKESYNHNRNVIPGLGLGFSQSGASWQSPWSSSQPGNSHRIKLTEVVSARDLTFDEGQETNTPATKVPNDNTAEEGEVSEGELEDIYEPREIEDTVNMAHDSGSNEYDVGSGDADIGNTTDGPSTSTSAGRDRSGSYSPYLSPREMDQQLLANSHDDICNGVPNQKSSLIISSKRTHPPFSSVDTNQCIPQPLDVKSIAEARKQAQDTILRLWPLNVRYQNYLDEGVDEVLLGSLFKELGFEVGIPTTMEAPKPSEDDADSSVGPKTATAATSGDQASENSEKPAQASTQDKSEERKDRIARLLAAKSSKPSSSTPIPASAPTLTATTSPSVGPSTPMSKTQSEKSKLLHQKMEALRKAREARGQKRPHPEESTAPNPDATSSSSTPLDPITGSPLGTAGIREIPPSQGQSSGATPGPDGQPPPPIPGLFLSSTPQPPQFSRSLNQERPTTASLSDPSDRPFKRPFGQTRESRPFLIDVSDDEDDAEMDIDSPEQHSLPAQCPTTPSLKTTCFRGVVSLVDNAPPRQFSSPIATPPGMTSDSSAKDDLESMNKKIEAMKRKIAEAEARKKAKQSRQVSPALPPMNDHSGDDSFEVTGSTEEHIMPLVTSTIVGPQYSRSPTQPTSDASPRRLPRALDVRRQSQKAERRSRSRVASDRLPLLEARRREQQLKLQLLQSQVASIEKEIEDSLQEEKQLRDDVVSVDSDSEQADPPSVEIPNLPGTADPLTPTEAMDISTASSASRDDIECSRDTTPGQAQASVENPVTDVIGSPDHRKLIEVEHVHLDTDSPGAVSGTVGQEPISRAESAQKEVDIATESDAEQDTTMEETGESNDGDLEDASDSYEPPDVESSNSSRKSSRVSTPFSPAPAEQGIVFEADDNDMQGATNLPAAPPISTSKQDSAPEAGREDNSVGEAPVFDGPRTSFVPYESPLRYFRAYRFHPEFNKSVAGGLRSLTYSNEIDVTKELCPDELAGHSCPRGGKCEYQHFEHMQAPDQQILVQLGAYENYDGKQKQDYIAGLKELLTDFKNRKVKDFETITQGIIDYRAQFLGDRSKILPLGNVTL